MAVTRFDIQAPLSKMWWIPGWGFMLGFPASADVCTLATGVPTNGVAGYGHGAIFLNYRGSGGGTGLYVNTGSSTSATWTNVA
jgi:hypothetical protein